MTNAAEDNLRLTDFMDLATLQEIQDSFAAVADVKAVITDADGNLLTQPTPAASFLRRQRALAETARAAAGLAPSGGAPPAVPVIEEDPGDGPQREGAEYVAPIIVNQQRLGTIRMSASVRPGVDEAKLSNLAEKFGLEPRQVRSLVSAWVRSKNTKPAAIQFLFLLANAIARLCYQEFQLRQRITELTSLNRIAIMLAEARDLQRVLDRTAQAVCEVMETKASSLRRRPTARFQRSSGSLS